MNTESKLGMLRAPLKWNMKMSSQSSLESELKQWILSTDLQRFLQMSSSVVLKIRTLRALLKIRAIVMRWDIVYGNGWRWIEGQEKNDPLLLKLCGW